MLQFSIIFLTKSSQYDKSWLSGPRTANADEQSWPYQSLNFELFVLSFTSRAREATIIFALVYK